MSAIILWHTTKPLACTSAIITPKNTLLALLFFFQETKALFFDAYQDLECFFLEKKSPLDSVTLYNYGKVWFCFKFVL